MEKIKQVNIKLSLADLSKRFKELGLRWYNKVYKKIVKEYLI